MGQLNSYSPIYNNDNERVERTSSMLDTPPQDKLHRHLYIFNACEHSCIMMIMVGSKMSQKEYDLKAIMYPAYDTPHKLCDI